MQDLTPEVPNGRGITCRGYSAEGRLTSEKAPGDTQQTTHAYDPAGARRTATDASGNVTFEYDESGRIKRSINSFGAEATFAYDNEGNNTQRTAAAGPLASNPGYVTTYVYDDKNQLDQLTDPAARVYRFTYDNRGGLRTTQYPNGTFSWAEINATGWLTALYNRHGTLATPLPASVPADANPLVDYTYTYDFEGRKTQEVRSGGGLTTETTSYVYDTLGRLEQVTLPSGVVRRYTFDLDSNRTSMIDSGVTVATYGYDPTQAAGVDQLTSVTENAQTRTFEYSGDKLPAAAPTRSTGTAGAGTPVAPSQARASRIHSTQAASAAVGLEAVSRRAIYTPAFSNRPPRVRSRSPTSTALNRTSRTTPARPPPPRPSATATTAVTATSPPKPTTLATAPTPTRTTPSALHSNLCRRTRPANAGPAAGTRNSTRPPDLSRWELGRTTPTSGVFYPLIQSKAEP